MNDISKLSEYDLRLVRSALIWYERGERGLVPRIEGPWRPLDVREALRMLGVTDQDITS